MFAFAARTRQSGVSLLEVLITVAISSIGLLGMAGLMIVSQRVSHDAYLRTQANLVAQTLIDSMHINASAVGTGAYDGIDINESTSVACATQGCASAQRAEFDRARFAHSLRNTLPNPGTSLECTSAGAQPTGLYNGMCRLEIEWSLRALETGSDNAMQKLVWHFQP